MPTPPPTIEQIIEALMYQIVVGKAHLTVAAGLADSDPIILDMAKTFFAMTTDAHLYSALMYAARLHDKQKNAVTVETLLKRAEEEKANAKYGSAVEVEAAIRSAQAVIAQLRAVLDSLDDRRNRRLAHNDPRALTNPAFAAAIVKEDYKNLNSIFTKTGQVVNDISRLFRDVTGILEMLDHSDYKSVIDFLFRAKCEQVSSYEEEFGAPAPFPKPKGYRRNRQVTSPPVES